MLKVKNKKVIKNLANKSFKANKLRNLFAIFSIILTSILFTSLFTISANILASFEEATMRQVGGDSHGTFKALNEEEYNKLSIHPSIKESGYTIILGFAENEALRSRQTEIRFISSEENAEHMFSNPTTGRLPQKYDEIALDDITLDLLGIKPELGAKIPLEYSLNGELRSDTFTLCGYWQGDRIMNASQVFISEEYLQTQLKDLDTSKNESEIGKIFLDVNFVNTRNIEEKMLKVITDNGYIPGDEIDLGVNWAYIGNGENMDIGTMFGIICALLLIIFCGYLIISNIFYISIQKDIKFYGLLKTIGTTGKQIKTLIGMQTLLLCIVGIPVGLIIGYGIGAILTPAVISLTSTTTVAYSINPIIFIGSAFFALITVRISTRKPAKIASKVSSIEALRSSDGIVSKKSTRKSGGVNLFKMALANVMRNKKKMILVTISLSLSLIMLNTTFSIVNGFDMDKYVESQIVGDFLINDIGFGNFTVDFATKETISQQVLKDVTSQSGIEDIGSVYYSELPQETDEQIKMLIPEIKEGIGSELPTSYMESIDYVITQNIVFTHLYGIDDFTATKLNFYDGKFDSEKFSTGNYIIVNTFEFNNSKYNYYEVGQKVTLDLENGQSKEYEVMAIGALPYRFTCQHSHIITPEIILPTGEYIKQTGKEVPMVTMLDVEDEYEKGMENFLTDYCANINKDLKFQSKSSVIAEFENLKNTFLSIGSLLSTIIAFIGIMNFINTIITSIISRRQECAMLQSIGMTKRQMNRLLIFEGLIYAGLTIMLVLTVGVGIGYSLASLLVGGMWFSTLNYTVLPTILCIPILAVFAMIVPALCFKSEGKRSVVERLREAE